MDTHEALVVWQKSITLTENIYKITNTFPSDERFGLVSQMRRAAVSIPSNIAEGFGRKGRKEFAQFLRIAYASSSELQTQLYLSARLNFISDNQHDDVNKDLIEVRKMLNKFITTLLLKH